MSNKLMYAASDTNADLLYFGKFFVPDPFLAFSVNGKRIAVLNALEIGSVRKESVVDEVLSFEEWREKAGKTEEGAPAGIPEIAALLVKEFGVGQFEVASDFPLGMARKLEALGLSLTVREGGLFPERALKTREEAEAIRIGNRASAAGIRAAEEVLQKSAIRDVKIFYENRFLTSERLREEIEIACLREGAVASRTIAAGGDQACDPH